jgi:hypothetical protein
VAFDLTATGTARADHPPISIAQARRSPNFRFTAAEVPPQPPPHDDVPNLRLLYVNRYSAATTTLTASSSATALLVGASKNPDRSYAWRSLTQTGVQTIDADFGSSMAVNACLLANVKTVGTGVVELYSRGTGSSPGSATLVATMPTQDRDTRTTFAFFNSVSARHWQLKWTNPTSASDYAELGHAFLGTYIEGQRNIRVPSRIARPDPSVASMSVDGQQTFRRRTKYFTGEWEFLEISEAQLTELRAIFDAIGVGTPFYAVLDTSLTWTSWFARFVGALQTNLSQVVGRYTVAMSWEEVR